MKDYTDDDYSPEGAEEGAKRNPALGSEIQIGTEIMRWGKEGPEYA